MWKSKHNTKIPESGIVKQQYTQGRPRHRRSSHSIQYVLRTLLPLRPLDMVSLRPVYDLLIWFCSLGFPGLGVEQENMDFWRKLIIAKIMGDHQARDHSDQMVLHTAERGFQYLYNYIFCDWGRLIKRYSTSFTAIQYFCDNCNQILK